MAAAAVPAWTRYAKLKTIGAGGSGQVYLAAGVAPGDDETRTASGKKSRFVYVCKRVYVGTDSDDAETAACAEVEVRILQVVPPHPNIVSFKDHFLDDEGYLNIITEFCRYGDLEKLITQRSARSEPIPLHDVIWLTFQLLCGVRHLHRHNVVHRDLKPGNVFLLPGAPSKKTVPPAVMMDNASTSSLSEPADVLLALPGELDNVSLKIADFGISKIMRTGSYANTVVGTPFYISPEICESRPYTASADLWAVGCIVYELCALEKLFAGGNMLAVVRAIAAANIPPLPAEYAPMEPLIRALVRTEPEQRLTADAAIRAYFSPRSDAAIDLPTTASGPTGVSESTKAVVPSPQEADKRAPPARASSLGDHLSKQPAHEEL